MHGRRGCRDGCRAHGSLLQGRLGPARRCCLHAVGETPAQGQRLGGAAAAGAPGRGATPRSWRVRPRRRARSWPRSEQRSRENGAGMLSGVRLGQGPGRVRTSERGPERPRGRRDGDEEGRCTRERGRRVKGAGGVPAGAGGGVRAGRGVPPPGRDAGSGEFEGAGRRQVPGAQVQVAQVRGLVRRRRPLTCLLRPGPRGAAGRPGRVARGAAGARGPGRWGAAAEAGRPGGVAAAAARRERSESAAGAGTTPLYRVGNSRRAPLPLTQRGLRS